ncbi:MAG: hypothetical protein O3A70_04245 [Bacteroidetes bacterium]|nr:hypothetical protein [Bacteroidota bacterium]
MNKSPLTFIFLVFSAGLFAQSPNAFNYQAALRDNQGALLNNQSVGLKIEIENSTGVVYAEESVLQTNAFGIINVQVGVNPSSSSNTFADIDWGQGPYSLKTYVDPNGGQSYQFNSSSDILSVPYAKYAERAENLDHGYRLLNFLPLADRQVASPNYLGHLMSGGFTGQGYSGWYAYSNNTNYSVWNRVYLNGYDSRLMIEAIDAPTFNLQGTAVALRFNHGSGTDFLWPDTSYEFFKDSTIVSLSSGFKGFVDFDNNRQAPQEGVYEIVINPNTPTETVLSQKLRIVDGVFGN